jgi:hypothetical protein
MEIIKNIVSYLAPMITVFFLVVYITLRSLARKAKRSEENDKKQALDTLRLEGYMVKYCGLPIEIFLEDLKDKGTFLSVIPDDDILTQILDKQIGK